MIDFAARVCYTKTSTMMCFIIGRQIYARYVRHYKRFYSRLFKIAGLDDISEKNNDDETYQLMHKRYIELKVILTTAGVNLTELDKIKE